MTVGPRFLSILQLFVCCSKAMSWEQSGCIWLCPTWGQFYALSLILLWCDSWVRKWLLQLGNSWDHILEVFLIVLNHFKEYQRHYFGLLEFLQDWVFYKDNSDMWGVVLSKWSHEANKFGHVDVYKHIHLCSWHRTFMIVYTSALGEEEGERERDGEGEL